MWALFRLSDKPLPDGVLPDGACPGDALPDHDNMLSAEALHESL